MVGVFQDCCSPLWRSIARFFRSFRLVIPFAIEPCRSNECANLHATSWSHADFGRKCTVWFFKIFGRNAPLNPDLCILSFLPSRIFPNIRPKHLCQGRAGLPHPGVQFWWNFNPEIYLRWWFQILFVFTPIWGRFPFWLIFFRGGWNHQPVYLFLEKKHVGCFPSRLCLWVVNKGVSLHLASFERSSSCNTSDVQISFGAKRGWNPLWTLEQPQVSRRNSVGKEEETTKTPAVGRLWQANLFSMFLFVLFRWFWC